MDAADEFLRRAEPSALLYLDGIVRSLNTAMATALSRPAEQCVGRYAWELVPDSQRPVVERLVTHASRQRLAMRVLDLPSPDGASLAFLVEARPMTTDGGEQLVWMHSLNVQKDLGSLLMPFRLSARAAGLGLSIYHPEAQELEWLGGAANVGALFPEASVSLPWVVRHVHPDDRISLRRLLAAETLQRTWTKLRFHTDDGDRYELACQTRRVRLGYDGPEEVFGMIRDDTRYEARRKEMLARLGAERRRAGEIAEFSSALIRTASEQELQQAVLTRLAATFGGTSAALALVDHGHLSVSSDGGFPAWHADEVRSMDLDERHPLPQVIRTGEPQFIADREELLRRWPQVCAAPPRRVDPDVALSITPLGPAAVHPLGAWVVTYEIGHRPSLDETAFTLTLAELAGQALVRIRSQQAHVELATAVQRTMLPKLPEHLPGLRVAARYRPCVSGLDIGGDWYDAFLMPDGTVVLEIGDAQGHDADAAAFMGQLRGSMRAIAAHEPDPGTMLRSANQLLVAMDAPRFASCSMLRIDSGSGQVTGASAGHVPLLCAHDDGSHDVRRLSGGPLLGVLPDAEYPQETFTLDKDTALVMVTDGVVEGADLTLDAGLEQTGTLAAQALHDGLSPEETAGRILDAAIASNNLDDVAVLIVRRA
ncbi:SpoIIE family protein phosphatase [Streptomyces sp. NPDC051105]|uniref:SpoIIE family protein phosphatase n=1 Tax=Streptomyces sp. NPDC051105 TaxID=3154843 RepID=UPI00341C185C